MNKLDILGYIVVAIIFAVCIYIYFQSSDFQLKCIVSTVDGNKYCVREREKIQAAADLLATVTEKCKKLVKKNKQLKNQKSIYEQQSQSEGLLFTAQLKSVI